MVEFVKNKKISNSSEGLKYITKLNNMYHEKYLELNPKKIPGLGHIKKKKEKLYFGIEKNYLQNLLDLELSKENITSRDRNFIWNINNGKKTEALCLCCYKNIIRNDASYHCGHIISRANKGLINRENIIPICSTCNLGMGTRNLFDYMKEKNYNLDYAYRLESQYNNNPYMFQNI